MHCMVELLLVLLVEVRRHAVISNTLGEEVDVALLARLVVYDLGSIFNSPLLSQSISSFFLVRYDHTSFIPVLALALKYANEPFGGRWHSTQSVFTAAAVVVVHRLLPTLHPTRDGSGTSCTPRLTSLYIKQLRRIISENPTTRSAKPTKQKFLLYYLI